MSNDTNNFASNISNSKNIGLQQNSKDSANNLDRSFNSAYCHFDFDSGRYYSVSSANIGVRKSFPKSLTDQSYYTPAKRAITGGNVTQSKIDPSCYDFPDGKINHSLSDSMVDSRLPGLDMVEKIEKAQESYAYAQSLVQSDLNKAVKDKVSKAKKEQLTDYTISQVVKGNAPNNNTSDSSSK